MVARIWRRACAPLHSLQTTRSSRVALHYWSLALADNSHRAGLVQLLLSSDECLEADCSRRDLQYPLLCFSALQGARLRNRPSSALHELFAAEVVAFSRTKGAAARRACSRRRAARNWSWSEARKATVRAACVFWAFIVSGSTAPIQTRASPNCNAKCTCICRWRKKRC